MIHGMKDDIELLNGIKNKNMASMEAFYRLHENIVYRFSLKKLNNEFDASEIVNTVMLEVKEKSTLTKPLTLVTIPLTCKRW